MLYLIALALFAGAPLLLTEAKSFLFRLEGEVPGEEFVYYKIIHPGNLLLVLETLEGDADVYVSEKNPTPTFHPETYDLQSATCGLDRVFVPKNLKRPVAIGIYGHSTYEHTRFVLEVYLMPDTENYFDNPNQLLEDDEMESTEGPASSDRREPRKTSSPSARVGSKRKLKNIPSSLWPFLELFEMLFL